MCLSSREAAMLFKRSRDCVQVAACVCVCEMEPPYTNTPPVLPKEPRELLCTWPIVAHEEERENVCSSVCEGEKTPRLLCPA